MEKHLSGSGCTKCTIANLVKNNKLPGGYCETIFSRNNELKAKAGVLYYMKVGDLYKIGITINIKSRVKGIRSKSKSDVEVVDVYNDTLYNTYLYEQEILKLFAKDRVSTRYSTEMFSIDILNGETLESIVKTVS